MTSDLTHIQTPTEQRGAQWWFAEHSFAEQGVTTAAGMVENARGDTMQYAARRLLDQRLDHLEDVENVCDALLCELRRTAPDVADMVERHYIKGEAWRVVGEAHGMSGMAAYQRAASTLAKAPRPVSTVL